MRRLVRDVLDKQLVGPGRTLLGKVDGITLVLRRGAPPRVARIEVGPAVLARRVSPRLARWVTALERRLGIGGGEPWKIPWDRIEAAGVEVRVDVDTASTRAFGWERWVREHVIRRIPGARKK